jgi:hypothetical protein
MSPGAIGEHDRPGSSIGFILTVKVHAAWFDVLTSSAAHGEMALAIVLRAVR